MKGNGDGVAGDVALGLRFDLGEGQALVAKSQRHLLDRVLDRFLAVGPTRLDCHQALQLLGIGPAQAGFDGRRREREALAFLHGERDDVARSFRVLDGLG